MKPDDAVHLETDSAGAGSSTDAVHRGELSNMLTQLRGAKKRLAANQSKNVSIDTAKSHLLEHYEKWSRSSDEKRALLDKWRTDKTCSWWVTYQEEKGQETTAATESYGGMVSKLFVVT